MKIVIAAAALAFLLMEVFLRGFDAGAERAKCLMHEEFRGD